MPGENGIQKNENQSCSGFRSNGLACTRNNRGPGIVSKAMWRDGFGNAAPAVGLLTGFFNGVSGDGLGGRLAGE